MSPKTMPRVTVVTACRNRLPQTLRFLGLITKQTYPDLHVVLVDSNSTDGTQAAVRKYFPNIELLSATDAHFWAGATNIGVKKGLDMASSYIFTINDDAQIESTHIEKLLEIAEAHGCLILGSQINFAKPPGIVWSLGTSVDWARGVFMQLNYINSSSERLPADILAAEVIKVDAMPGNGVLIHRSVFEAVGLYRERWLPHYHADSEFVMRAVKYGFMAAVTPKLCVVNEFYPEQKLLKKTNFIDLVNIFCHPRSYLYAPGLLFIVLRYCPIRYWLIALISLAYRLKQKLASSA